MRFYRTPEPLGSFPRPKPVLSGKALLYKLEDDYREYREACENRLCVSDPAVHADFKSKIEAAFADVEKGGAS